MATSARVLHHTATQCTTPQHIATHCNTPQQTWRNRSSRCVGRTDKCCVLSTRWLHHNTPLTPYCTTLQHTASHCNTLQHTATHCNTLQHTATHRTTPQHTATHRTWSNRSSRRVGREGKWCVISTRTKTLGFLAPFGGLAPKKIDAADKFSEVKLKSFTQSI